MYKLYKAQITKFGPPATVIVTVSKKRGGYYKSESFCIFPEPHAEKAFKGLEFDKRSFEVSPVELDEDFMLEEALGQARIDIALHIENHYSQKSFLIPDGEPRIEEVDTAYLVHLRVKESAEFLQDICEKTDCDELRELILPITGLPTIKRREL